MREGKNKLDCLSEREKSERDLHVLLKRGFNKDPGDLIDVL